LTLHEGNTPLIYFEHLSKELGIELYGKVEGINPTGSFKDRGKVMDVAKAKEAGSTSVICASTGNTSAYAAAYAAKANMNAVVIIPKEKVALGKLAQAIMYGAEIVEIDSNFDDELKIVKNINEPETIATAIRIGNPASWNLATAARDESNGMIEFVSDDEITEAFKILPAKEGVFAEPGSCASIAGVFQQVKAGTIPQGSKVV